MLDLEKPMTSRVFGKVVDFHIMPDWCEEVYNMRCLFSNGLVGQFTSDGEYSGYEMVGRDYNLNDILINDIDKCQLFNIEEPALPRYWSNASDVPMDALFIRYKNAVLYDDESDSMRSPIDIFDTGLIKNVVHLVDGRCVPKPKCFSWGQVSNLFEYYNGKVWRECRCWDIYE